jgi:RHS repeat-associated protein
LSEPEPNKTYSYTSTYELSGVNSEGYGYDASGNLTKTPTSAFSYDNASELLSALTGKGTTTYGYDQAGNRTSEQGTGTSATSCVLCVLDTEASGALSVNGNASVDSAGNVSVDSAAPDGAQASGHASISASEVFANATTTGQGSISPLAPPGSGIAPDPFAALSLPSLAGSPGALSASGRQDVTATPGVYSTISVSGSAELTLDPGFYVVTGSFDANGNATIKGSGVTVILACASYPSPCDGSTPASFEVSGKASISLDGGALGPAQGVVLAFYSSEPSSISMTGNSDLTLFGSVDLPASSISLTGNSSIVLDDGVLSTGELSATGNAKVSVDEGPLGTPDTTVTYDGAGRIASVNTPSTSASYTYDGDGLRSSTTTDGIKATFTWDIVQGNALALSDGVNDYVYGPGGVPIEQVNQSSGAATYLYTDQLGSVVMEADQSGTVTGTQSYAPYGSLASSTGTDPCPFGFAGGYTDPTWLIYLVNRYYDAATGQFLSVDPLVGSTGEPYGYVGDDPSNGIDPLGLLTIGFCGALGGSLLGPSGFAEGCLTRTQLTKNDEIGVVGTVGGGGAPSLAGFASGYISITNATDLSQLRGPFAYTMLNVGDEFGGSVIVFVGKDSSNKTVFGVEIGGGVQFNINSTIPAAPFTFGGGIETTGVHEFGGLPAIGAKIAWDAEAAIVGLAPLAAVNILNDIQSAYATALASATACGST